jgi:hypothetical protein
MEHIKHTEYFNVAAGGAYGYGELSKDLHLSVL